jgi:hypothetical protein
MIAAQVDLFGLVQGDFHGLRDVLWQFDQRLQRVNA